MAAALCEQEEVEAVTSPAVSYCFGTTMSVPNRRTLGAFLEEVAFGFGRMGSISVEKYWKYSLLLSLAHFPGMETGALETHLEERSLRGQGDFSRHLAHPGR